MQLGIVKSNGVTMESGWLGLLRLLVLADKYLLVKI